MSSFLSCPSPNELEEYMLGKGDEDAAARLEAHLAECPRCVEMLEAIRGSDDLLGLVRQGLAAGEPEPPVSTQLLDRLCRLPEETSATRAGREHVSERLESQTWDFLDPAQSPNELGRLGSYAIRDIVGRGGMGVVFRGHDPRLERDVAIKVILDSHYADPQRLARFEGEATALARLRHPHVVQVFEVGRHRGRPFLVLEYVEGGNLAEYFAGRAMPLRECASLLHTLAEAVAHVHVQGLVHRDLKPANVLLADGSLPKVVDFGLARRIEERGMTQTGDLLGTPGYMAPELARGGAKECGPAVDIYALGAILYEGLTGRPPFRGATLLETLQQAQTLEPVPPRRLRPGIPPDLDIICLKCLESDPGRRYATAAALAEDLGLFLEGRPIHARPAGRIERLLKAARRRPAVAALIGVSGIALVAGVVGAAFYERRLRAERDTAEALRVQARDNYQAARATLRMMLDRVWDPGRADLPGVGDLRREQQRDALAFFLQAAEQRGNDPEVRQDVAQASYVAGRLQQELGQTEEARANYERARNLWATLVAEAPHDPDHRYHLAGVLKALGLTYGHTDEGVSFLKEALALETALADRALETRDQRGARGLTHKLLGASALNRKQDAEADTHMRAAVALFEEILKEEPNSYHAHFHLAETQLNLHLLKRKLPHPQNEAAWVHHDRARFLLDLLHRENPLNLPVALTLALLRINRGDDLLRDNPAAVIADMRANVDLLTPFLERDPGHVDVRASLRRTHGVWASVLDHHGRHADEVAHRRRVFELATPEEKAKDQTHLAWTLARAGDHAQAFAQVGNLQETPDPKLLLHLAQTCAVASTKVQDDANLTLEDRKAKSEAYAVAAVRFLERLKEKLGPKVWQSQTVVLGLDRNLKVLRNREDYRRLIGGP